MSQQNLSQQNFATVRSGYDAFTRKDIPAVLEFYDPQIEWIEAGGGRSPAVRFHGPESVANDVFAAVPRNFDDFRRKMRERVMPLC